MSLGKAAYEAFAYARHWKTFNGETMPTWEAQQENMREAWQQSAEAVIAAYVDAFQGNDDVKAHIDAIVDKRINRGFSPVQ